MLLLDAVARAPLVELSISRNMKTGSKKMSQACTALADFIRTSQSLQRLTFAGSKQYSAGESLNEVCRMLCCRVGLWVGPSNG